MRLLLDTHVTLWALLEPDRIPGDTRAAIEEGANEVLVSVASIWEMAIKRKLGKLTTPPGIMDAMAAASFTALAISAEHAEQAGSLPLHHRDPFDRMLVAQAMLESLTIVTRDPRFAAYGVALLPA